MESPSSRRAWIEILLPSPAKRLGGVALLAEGVDRNWAETVEYTTPQTVALLAEGVDRNKMLTAEHKVTRWSPSSRRAWIEILQEGHRPDEVRVALLAEGVDRNTATARTPRPPAAVALLAEGVDRNLMVNVTMSQRHASPSSRRAWIEISLHQDAAFVIEVALLAEGVDRNHAAG